MSSGPPPPPPLPLCLVPPHRHNPAQPCDTKNPYANQDICNWETRYPELSEACAKYRLCLDEAPFTYKYKHVNPIIQVGPTCGLVALSMLIKNKLTPDEIIKISEQEGYTSHGEMLSCRNMLKLTEKVVEIAQIQNTRCSLQSGLFSNESIEKLLNGAALLVPYDADFNHSPCLRRGHTAHWALICGILLLHPPNSSYTSEPENTYVFARHGKSIHLAIWRLDQLAKSNMNLEEFSPKKENDGLIYVLPEGGLGGDNGLRDQFVIVEGLEN